MSTRLAAAVIVVAGLTAAMTGFYLASREHPTPTLSALELPTYTPTDGAPAIDGPAHHRGEVVVLDFWASWCTPCHVQSRLIGGLLDDFAPRGVRFFAVNVGESEHVIARSLAEHPIDFPVLMDVQGDKAGAAGVFGLPTLVILDRDGSEALRRTGLTSARFLRDTLEQLLGSAGGTELAAALEVR